MKPVIIHANAEAEIEEASEYYESQKAGLGEEFEAEVEAGIARISQMPQASPLHGTRGARKLVLRRFPYSIFFYEREGDVWVAAVAHHKRQPDYWAGRASP